MIEIPLLEIRGDDVDRRVIVTRDGNAFDGMLTKFWVSRSDYQLKGRPRVTAQLTIKTDGTELKLDGLPLDYRIQVERDNPVVFDDADPTEHGYEFNTPGGNA